MTIITLDSFVVRDSVTGELTSYPYNTMIEVDSETGNALISEGLAVESSLVNPTGKITITENGTDIDVASYAKADVNVSGGSSDFSTAEVGFINVTGGLQPKIAIPYELEFTGFACADVMPEETFESPFNVILYKGQAVAYLVSTGYAFTEASGGVEISQDSQSILITGNGTVKIQTDK